MNRSSSSSKRVSVKPHLSLYTQTSYQGFPLLRCRNGFVEEYLQRLYFIINQAIKSHSRVFAIRLDLHFPQFYSSTGTDALSSEFLQLFIKALKRRLRRYRTERRREGTQVHSVDFKYVWAREYGEFSEKPHFHLLLLFSGHAFNTLGHFSSDCESLYNRISESWAEALGIHLAEGSKFTHFPEIGQYLVNSCDVDQVAQVFCRASYLAKVETKNFHDGFHVFGSSRS